MVRLAFALVLLAGCAPTRWTLPANALAEGGCATTYACCLQRHPVDPEACGAPETPSVPKVEEPPIPVPVPIPDATKRKKPWPYGHCVDLYETCKGDVYRPPWFGPCDLCLNKCTSSGQWDFRMCHA